VGERPSERRPMDVKKLVEFTPSRLECLAREVFRRRPDVDCAIPINVELLIEDLPNVSLALKDNLRVVHSIEGYVCKQQFMGRQMEVRIDASICDGNWPHYNAVLGEEFAHLELHMGLIHAVQSAEEFVELQRDRAWPQYERDAKQFSRAVRIPAALLLPEAERLYPRLVNEHGYGDPHRIEKFLRNALGESFRVPTGDMQRRMMDWPCYISRRVNISVRATSDVLLPLDWSIQAVPPISQRSFL
jgi:hypothetical protein